MWSLSTYAFCLLLLHLCTTKIDGIVNINGPSSAEGYVGHDITLMWNTTNCTAIKSAIFGLNNEGMADPQFINVNMRTGKVHYNPEISKTYDGRVDFVGNLTLGHAWFIIKNLQVNDTNEYLARITIDVNTVKPYTVTLRVRQPNEFHTDSVPKSTLNSTPTFTPTNNININASTQKPHTSSSKATFMTSHDWFTMFLIITGQIIAK